ncbi:hypothetical protein GCM10010300_26070 [Streptomyces olivaceoviridis]|nr:hypothetical protein GCM10010300_26070 [Streptomyces olivaceoviridis]
MFRTTLFVVPFVTYPVTKRARLGLQAADRRRILEGGAAGEVRRTAGGGYEEAHTPQSREEACHILCGTRPGRAPRAGSPGAGSTGTGRATPPAAGTSPRAWRCRPPLGRNAGSRSCGPRRARYPGKVTSHERGGTA